MWSRPPAISFVQGLAWLLAFLPIALGSRNRSNSSTIPSSLLGLSCNAESGVGTHGHNHVVSKLDGRHIVFVGDSVTRYQYLELAFYLTYGTCPRANEPEYILNRWVFNSSAAFYSRTSSILTQTTEHVMTRETCFCSRNDGPPAVALVPGAGDEQRTFHFRDNEGHDIALSYAMYFSEPFGKIARVLESSSALFPTDVLLGLGIWMHVLPANCTDETRAADDFAGYPPLARLPPPLCANLTRDICPLFARSQRPAAAFKLWWLAPPPALFGNRTEELLPHSHHLNVARVCGLRESSVLDRGHVMHALWPTNIARKRQYIDSNHLHADAYHAFNHALLLHFAHDTNAAHVATSN